MNTYRSWIEIDLDVLRKNIQIIQKEIFPKKYCLPIKGNAYGHGIEAVAKIAQEERVDYLAVASLDEGITLRKANIVMPILVLGAFQKEEIQSFLDYNLEVSISSYFKAELVEEVLEKGQKKLLVHLKIDTGMCRIGARPKSAYAIYEKIKNSNVMELKGVYSHLAMAEEANNPFNQIQINLLEEFLKKIDSEKILSHLSNTSAFLNLDLKLDNMVRLGLLTFGLYPKKSRKIEGIESFFTLKSKVSYFKVIEEGTGVSYGHTYQSKKRTRIATLPIGYADGYVRALSNKGSVIIRGQKYPIVGNICMDQLMVDIGDGEAYVGDEAVLIGKQADQEITLDEVAGLANTISYEVLCNFNERLPRVYQYHGAKRN